MSIEEITKVIKNFYDKDAQIGGSYEILSVQERPDENMGDCLAYEVKSHVWYTTTDEYGNDLGAPYDYDFNYTELLLMERNTGEFIGRKRVKGYFPSEEPEEIFTSGWHIWSDCFQGRV